MLGSNKLGKVQSKCELIVKCNYFLMIFLMIILMIFIELILIVILITNLAAPRFIRKAEDEQVIEKRVSRLEVEVDGFPKPVIKWYKDGKEIVSDDRVQANDVKGGVYQLLIKNSRKDDTGIYTCRAENEIGKIECSAELAIEMAPQFTKKLEKLDAVEQCTAEWYFSLIGTPKPTLEITKDNQIIDLSASSDLYKIEEIENKLYCLKFTSITKKDSGTWKINAVNSAGQAATISKLETSPLVPPILIRGLTNTSLPQDVDNKIEVLVNGTPFPKSAWYKDGQKIDFEKQQNKYKLEVDKENGSIRLVIINSQVETDTGLYKVVLSNQGGEINTEGTYTVKGFPPKFVEKPEKSSVLQNTKAVFAASADGDPMPMITWSKNGVNLEESSDMDIYYDESIDTHFLEIFEAKSKDAGQYKCTASNIFGTETVTVILNVTQNREEIVEGQEDIRVKLRSRPARKIVAEESGPDWGKLKKAKPLPPKEQEQREGYKLRHVEKEKKVVEEVKKYKELEVGQF